VHRQLNSDLCLDLNGGMYAELNREKREKFFLKSFEKLSAELYQQSYRDKYV
jgi:hypothetical protein